MNLSNNIIVVTGGGGLLGSSFCKAIIQNNGQAIIADKNIDEANHLADELNSFFDRQAAYPYILDINDISSIERLIDFMDNKFGRINALVNNAYPRNKNYGRKFFEVTYNDFCENLNLNLGGYFLTSQQFSKYFLKQGYGKIINIASIYGVIAPRFEIYEGTNMTMPIEYAFIKSGIIHFTKYLAKLFKGKNIHVNSLSLGGIRDKQPQVFVDNYKKYTLNKGMLDKEDPTSTLVFLLSDISNYINGQNIIVDDGFTL
jgi:NAD(P)-dependent dehydrogenase (short-subunit alcohol dehydrogenase family)